MKESVAVAKEADVKKGVSPTRSDNSIHRVKNEPERQLGSLRSVIDNIRSDGGTPSVDSIATELSSVSTSQRAPALLALQRTHGNRYVQRVVAGIQAKLKVGQPGDIYEQEADRVADAVMRMPEPGVQRQPEEEEGEGLIQTKPLADPITPLIQRQVEEKEEEEEILQTKENHSQIPEVTPDLESSIQSLKGGGQPLAESERDFFEQLFEYDFSQVRLHDSPAARMTAAKLGARAFTYGNDIGLGLGESESDKYLMTHELAHVVQQNFGQIHLRRATWAEREFWLVFFPHYLPRKLLNNYMDDTGNPIELTQQEMIDCNVVVDLRGNASFSDELRSLIRAGGGSRDFGFSELNIANRTGTLANFTINYRGRLMVNMSEPWVWTFRGIMDFEDCYDFDPRPFFSEESRRTISGELKVRVGQYGIPGRPFPITSVPVPVQQIGTDNRANWGQQELARVPIGPVVPLSSTERTEPVSAVASREERYARRRRELAGAERPEYPLSLTERTEPAVQRVVAGIQAKLKIGQTGDLYEQEADRVADEVMRMPEPEVQRQVKEEEEEEEELLQAKPISEQITPLVQRQVEGEDEEEILQTKKMESATPEVTQNFEFRIQAIRGGGHPLAKTERAFFESRFGFNFSQVRIHTDTRAAALARMAKARAFTLGRDVVLGAGQYAPGTVKGKQLLAHELVHVIQQDNTGSNLFNSLSLGAVDTSQERGAKTISQQNLLAPTLPASILRPIGTVPTGTIQCESAFRRGIREFFSGYRFDLTLIPPLEMPVVGNPRVGVRRNPDGTWTGIIGNEEHIIGLDEIPDLLDDLGLGESEEGTPSTPGSEIPAPSTDVRESILVCPPGEYFDLVYGSCQPEFPRFQRTMPEFPTLPGSRIGLGGIDMVTIDHFVLDSHDVPDAAGPMLNRLVDFLNRHPELEVHIAGYTDSSGTVEHNEELSLRRAEAVRAAFEERNVANPSRLVVEGYGESELLNPEERTDEERAENRRVEIYFEPPPGERSEEY